MLSPSFLKTKKLGDKIIWLKTEYPEFYFVFLLSYRHLYLHTRPSALGLPRGLQSQVLQRMAPLRPQGAGPCPPAVPASWGSACVRSTRFPST